MGFRLPGSGVFGLWGSGDPMDATGAFMPLILIAIFLLLRGILARGLRHWSNLAYPIWMAVFALLAWGPLPEGFDFSFKAVIAVVCFPLLLLTELMAHQDE